MNRNSILTAAVLFLTSFGFLTLEASAQSRNIGKPEVAPPTNKVCIPAPVVSTDDAAQQVMKATKIRIEGTTIFFDAQLIPEVNKQGIPNGKYQSYWVSLIPTKKGDQFNRSLQIVKLNQTDLLFILEECNGNFVHYLVRNGIWQGEISLI